MFEKEIAECETAVYYVFGETQELYYNIKRLLLAACPKDEAAESAHCEALAIELANVRAPKGPGAGAANHFQMYAQDVLMRERAAARAGGYAQAMAVHEQTLLEAQDEHARLRAALSLEQAKRRAAEVELEAARAQLEKDRARIRKLQLKLSQAESY